jgi:hypothetical protein
LLKQPNKTSHNRDKTRRVSIKENSGQQNYYKSNKKAAKSRGLSSAGVLFTGGNNIDALAIRGFKTVSGA